MGCRLWWWVIGSECRSRVVYTSIKLIDQVVQFALEMSYFVNELNEINFPSIINRFKQFYNSSISSLNPIFLKKKRSVQSSLEIGMQPVFVKQFSSCLWPDRLKPVFKTLLITKNQKYFKIKLKNIIFVFFENGIHVISFVSRPQACMFVFLSFKILSGFCFVFLL